MGMAIVSSRWQYFINAVIIFLVLLACSVRCRGRQVVETIGIRNNNPGNLRSHNPYKWPGCLGVDSQGHMIFKKPIDGVRAIVINLKKYRDEKKLKTIKRIVETWVGPKNVNSKNCKNYQRYLALSLQVTPNTNLNLWDANTLRLLTKGIVYFENGKQPYNVSLYKRVFPR